MHQGPRGKSSRNRSVRSHRSPTGWLQSRAKRTAASPGKDTEGPGPGVLLPGTWGRRPWGQQPPPLLRHLAFPLPQGAENRNPNRHPNTNVHGSTAAQMWTQPDGHQVINR